MPKAIFGGVATRSAGDWRFASPTTDNVFCAYSLSEVMPLLKCVEEAVALNQWAVVMLSYEAAPAFDRALVTHQTSHFPLACAAFFDENSAANEADLNRYHAGPWQPLVTHAEYVTRVNQIRDFIRRGHTYQVNYTIPLMCDFAGDAEAWYRDLCRVQRAPYTAYLDLGRHKVLCLSPELFFSRVGDRLTTKPMKGTCRRGRWLQEDDQLSRRLKESPKDRSENIMIVDLLRNDLGKVSAAGSVKVKELFELEKYDTLWQMTSTIESTVKPGTKLTDLLKALFPCGSITGAPKVRTMEIIHELETFPRNLFTGTIGLIRPGGDCCFNVAIRTILLDSETGRARFGVGGGITYDSTPDGEYEECLTKAAFLTRSAADFQLIETILLDDGEFFLLERHLARLQDSSRYFQFQLNESKLLEHLESATANYRKGAWKARLLLSKDGSTDLEMTKLPPAIHAPQRVKFASFPIDTKDKFLFHKTTNRFWYEKALAESNHCDDVILWNEREEITESSIANVVVKLDGSLYTPPREAGLLAGTFREQLLSEGTIIERTILKEELRGAEAIFLINSVQKWRPAVLKD